MKKFSLLLFLCVAICFAQNSGVSSVTPVKGRYITRPLKTSADLAARAQTLSLPTWTATADGYTYEMVGASPLTAQSSGSATTTIPTQIVPVALTFSDGTILDPTAQDSVCSAAGIPTTLMAGSPLFNASKFSTGATTSESDIYPDYFQRANFWQYTNPSGGINPNYHIALTHSTAAVLKITVPAASGSTVKAPCGRLGEVDINWLDNYLTTTGYKSLTGVTTSTLPVFMLYNTAMYDTSTSDCCVLGYHSAFNAASAIQTYVVADFDTTGKFGVTADVSPFSHEIAEWLDDPLGTNPTPPWGNIGQVTGCQDNLEVGDPLSGTDIEITMSNNYTYHVQELAFLSWFYHQTPSIGLNGWYSSHGTFTTPAAACATTRTALSVTPIIIAAGGSATVNITVKPSTGTGTPTGNVKLVSSATNQTLATYTLASGAVTNATLSGLPSGIYSVTADYAGDGTYSPSTSAPVSISVGSSAVTLSPISLNFGSETVGSATAAQTVKLTNGGTAALAITSVSITGASPGDYSQTNTCGSSVAAAAGCTISVTFKPTAAGLRTASLSVADSASGSPQTVPLTGTGTTSGTGSATITASPSALSFGSVNLAAVSAAQTVTLSNTGTASSRLSITLGGTNPGDFPSTTTCGPSIAAGATCTVTVTFKPLVTGALSATLNFAEGTAASGQQTVTLTGTGVSNGTPTVTLSPASLAFGSEPEGSQTAGQNVTLTNSGTGALSITAISITGTNARDFTGQSGCPTLLAAGASCTIIVRLRPTETGTLTATLSVGDSAAGSPQTVTLSGTGTAAVPTHAGH